MQWQQEIFQQSKARLNADKLIGRSSLSSSCEDIESLLVEDEKEETPDEKDSLELCPKRRSGVIKAVLILIVLVAACGIIFLAAKGVFINPHSHPNSMSSTTSLYSLPNPSEYPDVDHGGRWQDAPDLSLFYAPHRTHGKDSSQTKYLLKDPCGHTAVEARARGCRFGVLNYAWLPEACFDEKMEEEFRTYTNWEFWSFPNKTAPVTWDEAAKGEHDLLFIEWECEFLSDCPLWAVLVLLARQVQLPHFVDGKF